MKATILPAIPALMLVSACAATASSENAGGASPTGPCDAAKVQSYLGKQAGLETGAALLRESGARTLRWAAPRSALTMDYRQDRLTVSYDDAMLITRIDCG